MASWLAEQSSEYPDPDLTNVSPADVLANPSPKKVTHVKNEAKIDYLNEFYKNQLQIE